MARCVAAWRTRRPACPGARAATLVLCVGDAGTCEALQREAVAAAACAAAARVGGRGAGAAAAPPLLLRLRRVDAAGAACDLLRSEQRPVGGGGDAAATTRLVHRLFDAAHLAAAAQPGPGHVVATLDAAPGLAAAGRAAHVVRVAQAGDGPAGGAAQLDACVALVRGACGVDPPPPGAAFLAAEARPVVAVCVGGRAPEPLAFALPALSYNVHNNLWYVAVANLDPVTIAVTTQLKIVFAAGFSRLLLGHRLIARRVAAICLLVLGLSLLQGHAPGGWRGRAAGAAGARSRAAAVVRQ